MSTLKLPSLTRLSILQYLHFFSLGAVLPTLSLYLTETRGLSGTEAGSVLAVGSVALVITPLLTALVVDRLVSSPGLFALLNLSSGVFFWFLKDAAGFVPILVAYSLVMATKGPTFALANSLTFGYLGEQRHRFPRVRLWGTAGWISAGWGFTLLSNWGLGSGELGMMMAAISSVAAGLYVLTLPKIRLHPGSGVNSPKKPWKLPSLEMAAFLGVTVVFSALDKFFFFGVPLHLAHQGLEEAWILPLMTLGQVAEIAAMALLPKFYPRLGIRRLFLTGGIFQLLRFGLLAGAGLPWITIAGIGFHGLCFSFFFAYAFVYIDSRTTVENRGRIHQLYMFLVEGVGVTLGNLGAGIAYQVLAESSPGTYAFTLYWSVPLAAALVSLGIMAKFFKPAVLNQGVSHENQQN